MKTLIALMMLIFSSAPFSAEKIDRDWLGLDKRDSWLFYASSVLLAVDVVQTRWIANVHANPDFPDRIYPETNPILGERPSNTRIHTYFLGVGIVNYLANRFLPRPLKYVWGLGVIGIEVKVVRDNYVLGVKADF